MALEAIITGDLLNVINVAVRTIPDSIRILPLVMALITINPRFLMGLVNNIHVIFAALRGNDHGQFRQIGRTFLFAGDKQGGEHQNHNAADQRF